MKYIAILIVFFTLMFAASTLNANHHEQELCEKLYADYLRRAQQALTEDKHEDALRFLLQAQAIAQMCAQSSEGSLPQDRVHESGHAMVSYDSPV